MAINAINQVTTLRIWIIGSCIVNISRIILINSCYTHFPTYYYRVSTINKPVIPILGKKSCHTILHYQQSLPHFSILNIILYSFFRSTLTPADIHCLITVLQDGIDFRDIRITKPLLVPDYKKTFPVTSICSNVFSMKANWSI